MIFIQNKYTTIYFAIITKAKSVQLTTYTENHHIIPKSLGGDESKDNIVALTARQHFICHWLLTKMTEGPSQHKMMFALYMMRNTSNNQQRHLNKITSRVFEANKEKFSLACKSRIVSAETKKKHSDTVSGANNPNFGKKHSPEAIAKIKAARAKQVFTDEQRLARSISQTGKTRKPHSAETKAKISLAQTGKTFSAEINASKGRKGRPRVVHSEETKAKMSIARKGSIPWNKGKKKLP